MDVATYILTLQIGQKYQHVVIQFMPTIVQSQARLMLITTLKMDNFDCTGMNAHFTACLWEGLIHKWNHTLLAPPLLQ